MRVIRYALAVLLALLILYVGACAATSSDNDPPLEHRWSLDLPHSPQRLWALMQDYDNWTQYAPMVIEVQVLHPGDAGGNGLLRRVIYQMPLGRRGSALELVTDVTPAQEYTYTMISDTPGNDQTGKLRLERLGRNETRLHFEERYNVTAFPWRLFEKQIYEFINKKNEESMRSMSAWLAEHPEYHPELVEH